MGNSYKKRMEMFEYHRANIKHLGVCTYDLGKNYSRILDFRMNERIIVLDSSCLMIDKIHFDFDGEVIDYTRK